ncbi:MAG: alkylation response protein AidB-like acyl-CoA dehydrogenase [Myxococcota bacterium]|jgi:alkylation response protein AidB-like acyl-CoA dehydrogenase
MDLRFSTEDDAFRAEVRAWMEANVPEQPLPSGDTAEGFAQHVLWEKTLFAAGFSAVSWPGEYGGREATLVQWLIFEEEYYRAGAPARVTQNGIFLLAPTIFEFGTAEQKARILKPMAAAEHLWGQAWSEPGSGSDLASVQCTAVRTEGGWKLSGQKTWCTRGMFCDSIYGLFRTDPTADRPHRGLTYFILPLTASGVRCRGVERLDGDMSFAEIFLEDVFVPDADVIGQVNQGWRVAMATTSSERGLTLRSPGRFTATVTRLIALYREHPGDAGLRDDIVRAWIKAESYRWLSYNTVARMNAGQSVGAESSLSKVFWSELDIELHRTAIALLGPSAELEDGPDGRWMTDFMFSLAGTIYAGTNEIQRNVIAERVLGLPRK